MRRVPIDHQPHEEEEIKITILPESYEDWITIGNFQSAQVQTLFNEAERLGLDPHQLLRDSGAAMKGKGNHGS